MKIMEQLIQHSLQRILQQVQMEQHGIHLADMDGDGDLDIVSASRHDTLLPGMKIMERQIHHLQQLILQPVQMAKDNIDVADIDGDGDLDIVSASENDDTIAWYENDGAADPTFTAADIATSADGAWDVFIADIDGDGDLDIVSASYK